MDDKAQQEIRNWKGKYFDSLDELEGKEQLWREADEVLRQCISRLTLAADDSDTTLNRQLDGLRKAIRAGADQNELRRLITASSERILKLDEQRKERRSQPGLDELFTELVGKIPFPPEQSGRTRAFRDLLRSGGQGDHRHLVDAFAALIGESLRSKMTDALEGNEPGEEGRRPGLLGKLFGGEREGGVAAPAVNALEVGGGGVTPGSGLMLARDTLRGMLLPLAAAGIDVEELAARVDSSQSEIELGKRVEEFSALLAQICQEGSGAAGAFPPGELLLQLIERLDIPAEFNDRVERIKSYLGGSVEGPQVGEAIAQIAELIVAMRSRILEEKGDLEAFLKLMTGRLLEIDETLQIQWHSEQSGFARGEALNLAVNTQVDEIEGCIDSSDDIDQLKVMIQQQVVTLRDHMERFRDSEKGRLAESEQRIAQLSQQLAEARGEVGALQKRIEDERNLALIDPLTGVPNRLAYNERIAQEFARWRRYGSPLTIAVWDIDKFKSVNDTYGHQAGDKVLSVVAKLLHRQVRETDFVARFGGEEFVLLLTETDLSQGRGVVENLRRSVEGAEFHFRGRRVPITISCGFAQFAEGDSAESVFARADKALYRAKGSGRNRCYDEKQQ